jgi:hypothetical protein
MAAIGFNYSCAPFPGFAGDSPDKLGRDLNACGR